MRHASSLAVAVALASAGCGFSFERSSEVLDRRVIGMQVEPPELIIDGPGLPPPVRLRALVVDPAAPEGVTEYEWRVCANGMGEVAATGRCDEAEPLTLIESGAKPLTDLFVDVAVPPQAVALVQQIAAAGRASSLQVTTQIRIGSDRGPLYGIKRVVLSPPLPAGKVANRNPHLVGLLLDNEPWEPGSARTLKYSDCAAKVVSIDPSLPGVESLVCEHAITPIFDDTEAEQYLVQEFDGDVIDLRERLRFGWFVDKGGFSDQNTSMPEPLGPQARDPLSTKWREPPAAPTGPVTVWVVVRDGRGGESWEKRQIVFEAAP